MIMMCLEKRLLSLRYDKKRMIVSILDKSIIPDIVTPDDIFYHTESLI